MTGKHLEKAVWFPELQFVPVTASMAPLNSFLHHQFGSYPFFQII